MSKTTAKGVRALLETASEMFDETGCVPGIDGEEVRAETMVSEAKEYISESIDSPEVLCDSETWDRPGFTAIGLGLAPKCRFRSIRTCCDMAVAMPWRTRATTPVCCKLGSATKTSNTPFGTPSWHRIGLRTSGDENFPQRCRLASTIRACFRRGCASRPPPKTLIQNISDLRQGPSG